MTESTATPTVGTVFRRAAEIMRERGQCKGQLNSTNGQVCLYGALDAAAEEMGVGDEWDSYWFHADSHLAFFAPSYEAPEDKRHECAASWNDEPDTTQTEVEKFLLFVADRADFPGGA